MQLNPGAFNAFLAGIGQQVKWRRSYACPCITKNSGAAKPNCPLCSGKGRIWDAAVDGVVGIAGQKTQLQWAQFGMWENGDAVLTVPENSPVYNAGQFDRIQMMNSTDPFSLSLTRGQNDKLRMPVEAVNRVFWLNPAGTAIVEGGLPTVAADGTLTWAAGEPPPGVTYSINGTRYSEYFIFQNYLSDRNEHSGARLPKRVVARSFDLFGR